MFYLSKNLKKRYEAEVREGIEKYKNETVSLLTEEDISRLPKPVQAYLHFVGALGKPKIWNVRAAFGGRMQQGEKGGSMKMKAVQYNFFKNPTRMFYMDGSMFGIPANGLHAYKDESGIMIVKVLGVFPVLNASGHEMTQGDTVTYLNDLCLLAPAALIDEKISWEIIDEFSVRATLKNGKVSAKAELYFDEKGRLINFTSMDRFMTVPGGFENHKWSTPIYSYKKIGEYNLPSEASAIWHLSDREFKYAELKIEEVEYNIDDLK